MTESEGYNEEIFNNFINKYSNHFTGRTSVNYDESKKFVLFKKEESGSIYLRRSESIVPIPFAKLKPFNLEIFKNYENTFFLKKKKYKDLI